MSGYISLLVVLFGYVVSLAGDLNWAGFSQKSTWEDFIGNFTFDFCSMLLKKSKNVKK